MAAERYIHRCGETDAFSLIAHKDEPRLRAESSAPWRFWMQITRHQVVGACYSFGSDAAIRKIQSGGFFLFIGTVKLLGPLSQPASSGEPNNV